MTQSYNIKILHNVIEEANYTTPNQEAMSIWAVDGFEAAHNTLLNCRHEGIDVKAGSRNGAVHHNEVRGEADAWPGTGMGIYIDGWHYETFNLDVYNNLVVGSEEGAEISCEQCGLGDASAGVHDVRVFNNVFIDNLDPASTGWKGRGMSFYATSATPIRVYNIHVFQNTIVGNLRQGIFVDNADLHDLYIRNNILIGNGTDINLVNGSAIVVENNILSVAVQSQVGAGATLQGNSIVDPQFVNAGARDLHLTATSPAVNAASGTDVATFDFDDVPRPQGPASDLGAFEFYTGTPVTDAGTDGPPGGADGPAGTTDGPGGTTDGPAGTTDGPPSPADAGGGASSSCGCRLGGAGAPGLATVACLAAGLALRRRRPDAASRGC